MRKIAKCLLKDVVFPACPQNRWVNLPMGLKSSKTPYRKDGKLYREMISWSAYSPTYRDDMNLRLNFAISVEDDEYDEYKGWNKWKFEENEKLIKELEKIKREETYDIFIVTRPYRSIMYYDGATPLMPPQQLSNNIAKLGLPLIPLLSIYDDSLVDYVIKL